MVVRFFHLFFISLMLVRYLGRGTSGPTDLVGDNGIWSLEWLEGANDFVSDVCLIARGLLPAPPRPPTRNVAGGDVGTSDWGGAVKDLADDLVVERVTSDCMDEGGPATDTKDGAVVDTEPRRGLLP